MHFTPQTFIFRKYCFEIKGFELSHPDKNSIRISGKITYLNFMVFLPDFHSKTHFTFCPKLAIFAFRMYQNIALIAFQEIKFMTYTENYTALKNLSSSLKKRDEFDTIEMYELNFESRAWDILPGVEEYHCGFHQLHFNNDFTFYTEIGTIQDDVHIKDIYVEENQKFQYYLIKPVGSDQVKKFIFFFHGFNEKNWEKYLPWAKAICEGTGNAVVLFPIAFHMQRAPEYWSSKREMYELSESRKKRFPNIVNSTLMNVAISMRLHAMPQRFIWSGLQTYYDVIKFIESLQDGRHPHIHKDAEFDIFGFSIGGFLAQILKLSNHNQYFDKTKVCLFCSGATFNRLSPVSKFILDSEASVALYSFLVEHFDKILQKDKRLRHYIKDHVEGNIFYSMLDYQKMRDFRESLLKRYEDQIYAVTLKKDSVIPSFEIMNALKGAYRDINITVDELDFDSNYIHENPFPVNTSATKRVDENFKMVFDRICHFFNA